MGEGRQVLRRENRIRAGCAGAVGLALLFLGPPCALAHPPGVADEDQAVAHEVEALRETIKTAVQRRDERLLRAIYADRYTHTLASGRVQNKAQRLSGLLQGEPGIETAPTHDLNYSVYRDHTIVVTGTSVLRSAGERRPRKVRWLVVYAKTGPDWQVVASQITRVAGE